MNIPTILQGLKAEKFIDWVDYSISYSIEDDSTRNYGLEIKTSTLSNIIDFYKQPFTPNMIEELFEGWGKIFKNTWENEEYSFGIRGKLYQFCNGDKCYKTSIRIKTLSDFISACNNSGITLTFKEQK